MKNLQNILLENILRYGVKNLSESDIQRLSLLEQETKEKSLTKRINFPSGMHSAQRGNVAGVLGPQLKEMQDFLVANKGAVVEIILSSSESLVTNYDGEAPDPKKAPLKPGQLSQMRYKTIETYMTQWLQGLLQQGIITTMPEIKQIPSQFGTTPYKAGVDNPRDTKYTAEQWLQVTLRVVAEDTSIEPLFSTITTYREAIAAEPKGQSFNPSVFYNYSVAPAAVLNKDPKSLPGALLTMNTVIGTGKELRTKTAAIGPFKTSIQPNGGQKVPLVILDSAGSLAARIKNDRNTNWKSWTATIANSYSLIVPFKPGSKEYELAWLFLYWYIKNSFPADWEYIDNKPNINYERVPGISSLNVPKNDSRLSTQQQLWSKKDLPNAEGQAILSMAQWYKNEVKDFYQ
jgi:hypothetical protein